MKKNLLKLSFLIGLFLFAIFVLEGKTQAASISISPSKTSVNSGESVTITISSDCTGRINLSTTGGTLTPSSVWVEGNSQSVTLKTSGTGTITVTANPATLSTSSGQDVEVSAKSCSINIISNSSSNGDTGSTTTPKETTPTKSNNAKLGNLGITPNDFTGFSPSKTSYSVTVPNSVSSINIYANKGQSGQTISGTGNKTLEEGVNQFSVIVTAEDGTTKTTYNLSITRQSPTEEDTQDQEEENTTDTNKVEEETTEDEEEQTLGLKKLTIADITLSPEFEKNVYEYTAKLIGDKTELDIKATAIDEGQTIEIIGNKDLKEGENIITIMVTSEDEKETKTYQITVNKSLVDEEAIAKEKEEQEKQQKKQQRLIIIGILGSAIVIISIILIVRYIRYRRENIDEDEEEFPNISTEDNEEYFEETEELEEVEEKPRKKRSKGKRFKD